MATTTNPQASRSTTTLSTKALQVGHGKQVVINNLTFFLPENEVTAIVGLNGCGKSTLLNALGRVLAPKAGLVILNGADIQSLPSKQVAKKIALLPQETTAPEGMTILDLVRFGRQPHQQWFSQWSTEDQHIVKAALKAANLLELQDRELDQLSGGQRQRAWIAMTLAQDTPLLLLDEPTSALDLGHQIEVFELIRSLTQQGKTVAMVVHDLMNAARYASHLVAMREGQIIAQGKPQEILTSELVYELYQIHCDVISDPVNGCPLLVNIRR
ncbi:MAG: ABC transporter ATP-binding protein [Clostridiales bacterium]|nr:ABC transporter ATP-binding protein [Clostridiales bacterium]